MELGIGVSPRQEFENTLCGYGVFAGPHTSCPFAKNVRQMWSVALSPDGRRLAAGGQDGSVRLWDTATGDSVSASDSRHSGRVLAVVFSRDKTRLATASDDGTVRLWNADTGDPLGAPLTGHSNAVRSVAFNPDGQRLTSAGFDKAVRTWPAVATPEMLCDKLTINMSRAQWREWISDEPDIDYQKCQPLCSKLPRPPD